MAIRLSGFTITLHVFLQDDSKLKIYKTID